MPPVGRRSVEIIRGIQRRHSGLGDFLEQSMLGPFSGERGLAFAQPDRRAGHSGQTDARARQTPSASCSVTAALTMPKSPLRRLNSWNDQPAPGSSAGKCADGQEFVRLQGRGEKTVEQILGSDRPRAASAANLDASAESDEQQRQLGRRITVREASADGSPVSDRRVADPPDRVDEKRVRGPQDRRALRGAMACHGSDPHAVAVGDPVELGDAIDVDEMRGRASRRLSNGIRLCPRQEPSLRRRTLQGHSWPRRWNRRRGVRRAGASPAACRLRSQHG